MFNLPLVIIRGGGDLGTGAAFRLYKAGFPVVITELACPRMVRRTVCFGEAIYDGSHNVEGVTARRMNGQENTLEAYRSEVAPPPLGFIPILQDTNGHAQEIFIKAKVFVDARMMKQVVPDMRRKGSVTVGLGPGFTAGDNVDFAVETMRGPYLGRVLEWGSCIADTGEPGIIAGEGVRRLIRAPQEGVFMGEKKIGDLVQAGDVVGYVNDIPVKVEISGLLRGLIHSGLTAKAHEKIGDCDPRGASVDYRLISDKARAVGGAVLEAVMRGLVMQKFD